MATTRTVLLGVGGRPSVGVAAPVRQRPATLDRHPRGTSAHLLMRRCWLLDNSGGRMPASLESSRKEAHLVGLVLISHSGTLVNGLRDMVAQVAGDDVAIGTAGG